VSDIYITPDKAATIRAVMKQRGKTDTEVISNLK